MDREICKNLYQKYQELKEKTKLEAHKVEPGGKVEAQHIPLLENLKELEGTKKDLADCLDFLSDNELIDISKDDIIGEKAREILMNRRK